MQKITLIFLISFSFHINLKSQIDMTLDSLIRAEIKKIYLEHKRPPRPDELDRFTFLYYEKKDSTFISKLNNLVDNGSKKEVFSTITSWLDIYNIPGYRNIDVVWHKVMGMFYSYDRYEALKYCEKHRMLYRISKDDMYKDSSIQDPITVKNFPYMDFLYKHYPLTEVLPLILQDNDLNEEETLLTAYQLYKDFSRNQCQNDTACIDNAIAYTQLYFKLNKDLKPKPYYLEAFASKNPTLTEYIRIQQEKWKQDQINRYKEN